MAKKSKPTSCPRSREALVNLMYVHSDVLVAWEDVFLQYEGKGDIQAFHDRFFADEKNVFIYELIPFIKFHTSYWAYIVQVVVMILENERVLVPHYVYRDHIKRPHKLLPRKYYLRESL